MANRTRSPLEGIDRLIVDGTNLLYAMRRGPDAAPPAALIGRLRASIPAHVSIDLVFDGPSDGFQNARVASGIIVRYSGGRSADRLIGVLVDEVARLGPEATASLLVATDDRDLRDHLRAVGASTVGGRWLIDRLAVVPLSAPTSGRPSIGRNPNDGDRAARTGVGDDGDGDGDAPRWQPGRGATRKRGNPKRGH